jgi:hypothetical protein
MSLAWVSVAISVPALLVALASAAYTRITAGHAKRQADAAEATLHDQRTPHLVIELTGPPPSEQVPWGYYSVRNDGPQDLDEVTVYRPLTTDGIVYRIGYIGQKTVPEELSIGAIMLGREASFALQCGAAQELPPFRVKIECRKGAERWQLLEVLEPPRPVG